MTLIQIIHIHFNKLHIYCSLLFTIVFNFNFNANQLQNYFTFFKRHLKLIYRCNNEFKIREKQKHGELIMSDIHYT